MPNYATITENELLEYCQRGDHKQEAFQELVQRYQNRVIWIAYQMLGNYEDALDISQEAFIRVYRSLEQFRPDNNFYTWLHRIVTNLCIDSWRKNKNSSKDVILDEAGDIDTKDISVIQSLENKEISEKIQQVLNQLPIQYRIIIVLRDIQGFSCKEIENIISCNHNTVRWRLFRARQLFAELWNKLEKN